jgi:hypothetical protein
MANLTVVYTGQDTNHVTFDLMLNGVFRKAVVFHKSEFTDPVDLPWEDLLVWLMREACRAAGATTLAQCRTAVEAKTWSV